MLGSLALGLQCLECGKAAQHDHLVEHTDVGEPATQQLALRLRGGCKGLHVGGGLACGAKGQGHGGEFVVHGVFFRGVGGCVGNGVFASGCRVATCGVVCSDEAKSHGRAQRDAAGRVVAAHHAAQVIATGIQARDGLALGVDNLGVVVHAQTGKCAQAAHDDLDGIKRSAFDGAHAGVAQAALRGLDGIALDAVVRGFAFAKVAVFAVLRERVVALHSGLQGLGVDATSLGQFVQAVPAFQVTVFQPGVKWHGRRFDRTQTVVADEGVVANQPGLWLVTGRGCGQQVLHEVVVRVGLVGKAQALRRDRNQAGLGALDQVRKVRHTAVLARHQRHGGQRGGLHQIACHHTASRFAHAQTITGVAAVASRPVLLAGGRVGQELLFARRVVWEATRGQDHAAASMDAGFSLRCLDDRPRDTTAVLQQAQGGAVDANVNA